MKKVGILIVLLFMIGCGTTTVTCKPCKAPKASPVACKPKEPGPPYTKQEVIDAYKATLFGANILVIDITRRAMEDAQRGESKTTYYLKNQPRLSDRDIRLIKDSLARNMVLMQRLKN